MGSVSLGILRLDAPSFVALRPATALEAAHREASAQGAKLGRPTDRLIISEEARRQADKAGLSQEDLSEEEQQEAEKLRERDHEVRQHGQAHVAAGGQYVQGGAHFTFTRGPDGRQYATGGEVSIDVSAAATPQATIQKAQVVRRAALAPGEPSAQDRQVAAQASQLEARARQELAEQQVEETRDENSSAPAAESTGAGREDIIARSTAAGPYERFSAEPPALLNLLA